MKKCKNMAFEIIFTKQVNNDNFKFVIQ